MMEDLGDVERDKKEKKLQIAKPDAYDGSIESNPTYQRWYETINDYLYHNRGSWEGNSNLIRVVGVFMKGKAQDWYDNLARQLRSNRKIDSWSAFVSAMDERFTTSHDSRGQSGLRRNTQGQIPRIGHDLRRQVDWTQ